MLTLSLKTRDVPSVKNGTECQFWNSMGWTEQTRGSLAEVLADTNSMTCAHFWQMPTCRPFPFLPPFPFFCSKKTISTATRSGEKEPRESKEPQRWTTPGRLGRSLFPSLHIFCAPNSRHRRNATQRAGWKALKVSMAINIQMSEYLFNVNAPARHVPLFCSKHNNGTCHSLSGSSFSLGR